MNTHDFKIQANSTGMPETTQSDILSNAALLLIDIQKAFEDLDYWGNRNNADAEFKCSQILALWRRQNLPIFHIKHCSQNPISPLREGKPGNDFNQMVYPKGNEPIIRKNVNSAFIGTELKELLNASNIKTVVIVGLTTDHCVSTSARMAANLGFKTYIIADATATFDKTGWNGQKYPAEMIHETALASLHEEFATILNTEDIMKLISSRSITNQG